MAGITYPYGDSSARMDAFLSATAELLHKKGVFQDTYFYSQPTWAHLKEKGRTRVIAGGGHTIAVNLMYAGNDTVGSVGPFEELDLSPQDGATRAFYDWAEYAGAITISDKEKAENSGKQQIVDLVTFKVKQTALTRADLGAKHLFDVNGVTIGAASSTGNGGKNMLSLPMLAHYNAAGANSEIGGIDGNTYSWWQPQALDYVNATHTYANMASKLNTLYVNLQVYGTGGAPDFGCTSPVTWSNIVATLDAKKQLMASDEKMATLGFHNIKYLNCTLYPEAYMCDAESGENYDGSDTYDTLYMLKSNSLTFYQMKGRDFKPGPFRPAPKQLATTAICADQCQLTTDNRRNLGVLYGIAKTAIAAA